MVIGLRVLLARMFFFSNCEEFFNHLLKELKLMSCEGCCKKEGRSDVF